MRYYEIIESRRNPEQNPKVSTLDSLKKYAGRDDVFVSFTSDVGEMSHGNNGKNISGSKLGINPKSEYDTPIGIYTYPIDYVLQKKGKVPFAEEAPFLYVVQTTKPLLDLNNYSKSDFERDSKKLIDMGFADTRDEGIRTAKFYTPAGHLWNWTRLAAYYKGQSNSSSKSPVQWPKILRSLGYSGAIDLGSGLIHESEPTQAVFFSINAVKVLEVIHNRFKSKLDAVTENGFAIQFIDNPSEKVKLAAVTQNGYAIQYIDGPSEAIQLAAVTKNGLAIEYIIKKGITPSEQVQLAAVTQNPYAIEHIENPSEQVQLAAVNNVEIAITYIKKPSEEVQLAALRKNKSAIQYIKNPSEAVQLVSVEQDGITIKYIIEKGITPSEQVQLAAVTEDCFAIKYIDNPSEAVQLAAVTQIGRSIKHIKNPSEAVKKAAGL